MSTEADGYWRKIWKEHYQQKYSTCYKEFCNDFVPIKEEDELEEAKQKVMEKIDKVLNENVKGKKNFYETSQYFNSVGYFLKNLEQSSLENSDQPR